MDISKLQSNLDRLIASGKLSRYHKGQVLQSTDDAMKLSYVKSGYVKRYLIANDGTLGVQSIYGRSDIFPLTLVYKTLFGQEIYQGNEVYYYETMSDTEIYTITAEVLVEAVEKTPLLYRDLFSVAGDRLKQNINMLENLSLQSSYHRVAHILAYFAREFGVSVPSGIKITAPLTHLLIANTLSITRETVSQSMIQLRDHKLIRTGKNIIIPDIDLLYKESLA